MGSARDSAIILSIKAAMYQVLITREVESTRFDSLRSVSLEWSTVPCRTVEDAWHGSDGRGYMEEKKDVPLVFLSPRQGAILQPSKKLKQTVFFYSTKSPPATWCFVVFNTSSCCQMRVRLTLFRKNDLFPLFERRNVALGPY